MRSAAEHCQQKRFAMRYQNPRRDSVCGNSRGCCGTGMQSLNCLMPSCETQPLNRIHIRPDSSGPQARCFDVTGTGTELPRSLPAIVRYERGFSVNDAVSSKSNRRRGVAIQQTVFPDSLLQTTTELVSVSPTPPVDEYNDGNNEDIETSAPETARPRAARHSAERFSGVHCRMCIRTATFCNGGSRRMFRTSQKIRLPEAQYSSTKCTLLAGLNYLRFVPE